jgi:hypothetical protein
LPGPVDRDQQPGALAVRGDDHALEQVRRQLRGQLGGQRRAAEDAQAADAGVDDGGARKLLPADRGADAVRADQDVTLSRAAVGQRQPDAVGRLLVPGDGPAGVERVTEPGPQDGAQGPPVHPGVRAFACARP